MPDWPIVLQTAGHQATTVKSFGWRITHHGGSPELITGRLGLIFKTERRATDLESLMASRISPNQAAEHPHLVDLLAGDVDLDLFFGTYDADALDDESCDAALASQQPVHVWSIAVSRLTH